MIFATKQSQLRKLHYVIVGRLYIVFFKFYAYNLLIVNMRHQQQPFKHSANSDKITLLIHFAHKGLIENTCFDNNVCTRNKNIVQ